MATSELYTVVTFTDGTNSTNRISAATNTDSPADSRVYSLASGDNTILAPSGGFTVTSATIIPPVDNTVSITIKGDVADVGIRIHDTNHTVLGIDTSTAGFYITTDDILVGLRIIWS